MIFFIFAKKCRREGDGKMHVKNNDRERKEKREIMKKSD